MVYDREEFLEDQAGYEPDPDPEQSDSSQVQPLKRREALPIKIDPMDPATLGSGKVGLAQSNLRKNGYQTPAETLEPLLSADAFYSRCVVIGPKPKPAPKKDTRVPRANVKDLEGWGLIATVLLHVVVCFGMLFTVPKPSTGTHRVIFDGWGTHSSHAHRISGSFSP